MLNENIPKLRKLVNSVFQSTLNVNRRKRMDKFLKYYKGEYWKEEELRNKSQSGIFTNFIFSTISTIAPLLTDSTPVWAIRARKPEMQSLADIYKMAGDCLFETLDIQQKLFLLAVDALTFGLGLAKVYFDPERDTIGEVSVDLVDPREFVMAPGYTDIWDCSWCGVKTRKPLDYIRATFENGDEVKPDNPEEGQPQSDEDAESKDYVLSSQFATIYEIWMRDGSVHEEKDENGEKRKVKNFKNGSKIVVFANGMDKPLLEKEYPYNHGKPPYVPLYDYVVPHDFWGLGECDQIETLTLEFNLVLKKICKYIKDWADPNFYADSGAGIDPEKWKSDAPGGGNLFMVNTGSTPPVAANMPTYNSTAVEILQSIPQLIEEISGVTDMSKGMVSKKQRQSASEISALMETSYTRTRQRVRNLEWTIKRIFTLIVEIMQQYYTEVRTYGKKTDTGMEWMKISNSKEFAQEVYKPSEEQPQSEIPEEAAMEQDRIDKTKADYEKLMEKIGDEDSVHFPFEIFVDTNSTLPLDKQSLANLMLRLAEVQITPNSAIDTQSLLETLQVPRTEQIIERIKKAQESQMAAAAPQGMPPGMPGAEGVM